MVRHFLRLLINVGGGGGGGGGGGVAARGPGRGAENKVTGSAAAVIMQTHVTARICIGTVITPCSCDQISRNARVPRAVC